MREFVLLAIAVVLVGCTPFVLQRDKISGDANSVVVKTGKVWNPEGIAYGHCQSFGKTAEFDRVEQLQKFVAYHYFNCVYG